MDRHTLLIAPSCFAFAFMVTLLCSVHIAVAQPPSKQRDDVSLSVNPSGTRQHVPGRWATMSVSGSNHTDQDSEELVVVQLGDDQSTQFARRIWIPSQSLRQSWMPVFVPKVESREQQRMEMTSIRLNESSTGESFQANEVGQPLSKRSLLLSPPGSVTAVLTDVTSEEIEAQAENESLLDALHQLRDASGNELGPGVLANFSGSFLPPQAQALDSIDQMILPADAFTRDSTAVARIGQWLRDGGRLWIMLDRLPEETVRRLLGGSDSFTAFDRVELNEFTFNQINPNTGETVLQSQWSGDTPVTMVRGTTGSAQVLCTIDDWPAAFTKEVGDGVVFFTTVDVQSLVAEGLPMPAFRYASTDFFAPKTITQRYANVMAPLVQKEIGYQIPRRSIVAAILGAQLLLILAIGIYLAKTRRLDRLAIAIPIIVAMASISLLWLGKHNAGSIPATFASGQFVRIISGGSEALVDSISAVYSDQKVSVQLAASPQTKMWLPEGSYTSSRLLWTDDGKSQWMNLMQPPGVVRQVSSETHVPLQTPWTFQGVFTQRGFEGQLNGTTATDEQNALVVSDSIPALALTTENDAWVGTPESVLSKGQFASGSLLTDDQRSRQSVLRELLTSNESLLGRDPALLFWTDAKPFGLEIGEPFSQRGAALVAMPIRYLPTPPGTPFRIPASFLRLEVAAGEQGLSTLYNPRTGQWIQERTRAQSSRLRCHLPPSVLPCKLTSAIIEIKLSAPSRTLQIDCLSDDDAVTLHREENPNGLIRIPIDDPTALALDADGSFLLEVSISKTDQEKLADNTVPGNAAGQMTAGQMTAGQPIAAQARTGSDNRVWQIDFLRITADGKTL